MNLRKKSNVFKLNHLRNSNKLFYLNNVRKLLTFFDSFHRPLVFIGLQR
jgi:hypothetical protein